MIKTSTPQEEFWQGEFGNQYTIRNNDEKLIISNISLFSKIFSQVELPIKNIIELGAGSGNNIKAIRLLLPTAKISAVDVNKSACKELKGISGVEVHHDSVLTYRSTMKYDFVFTKGVLIHINPDKIKDVYSSLYRLTKKYILLAEYYNPTPTQVDYRGNKDRLFKRDFAGEIMDIFPKLKLLDYGFVYHRDTVFPMDDISWFLLEKK